MKSFEEREAILERFCEKVGLLKPLAALALAAGSNDIKKTAAAGFVSVYEPVLNMYGEGLNEAINPVSEESLPMLIIALKLTLQKIEEKNPDAAQIADTLMPLYGANIERTEKYKPFDFRRRGEGIS